MQPLSLPPFLPPIPLNCDFERRRREDERFPFIILARPNPRRCRQAGTRLATRESHLATRLQNTIASASQPARLEGLVIGVERSFAFLHYPAQSKLASSTRRVDLQYFLHRAQAAPLLPWPAVRPCPLPPSFLPLSAAHVLFRSHGLRVATDRPTHSTGPRRTDGKRENEL